jgi:hypothetical protein
VDWETAQEDLGRTPAQIEQMRGRRKRTSTVDTGVGVQQALLDAANAGVGPCVIAIFCYGICTGIVIAWVIVWAIAVGTPRMTAYAG